MPNSALDLNAEIRWGDQVSQNLPALTDASTNQLVTLSVEHPETWTLFLFAAHLGGLDVANHFRLIVNFEVITGSGSGQVDLAPNPNPATTTIGLGGMYFILDNTLGAVTEDYKVLSTPYDVAFRSLILPAKSVQVRAGLLSGTNVDMQVQVGAFIAPRFYQKDTAGLPGGQLPPAPPEHWMDPGFETDPMRYHGR